MTVNGSHIGGSNYAVNGSSGTEAGQLGGSGTIALSDNLQTFNFTGVDSDSLATLRPGASSTDTAALTLGSLAVNTTVNLNNFSLLQVDVDGASMSDRVDVFGDLTLGAGSALDLISLADAFDGSSYVIASYTGSLTGTFGSITGLDPAYEINYGTRSNSAITLNVIPEPASLALLGLGGLCLLSRRRD